MPFVVFAHFLELQEQGAPRAPRAVPSLILILCVGYLRQNFHSLFLGIILVRLNNQIASNSIQARGH